MPCGIRYSNAKISMKGSDFKRAVFGLQTVRGHEVGVMVEGEINAMSIWLACQDLGISADVVSVGTQGSFNTLAEDVAKLLSRSRHIVLWADEAKFGERASQYFSNATVLYSHNGNDANKLLVVGQLTKLLAHVLPSEKPAKTSTPDIETLVYEGRFDEALRVARGIKNTAECGRWVRPIALMKREKENG